MGRKVNDITGYKAGRIEVIGKAGKNKSGNILWRYKCCCGGGGITTADAIRRIYSCGCMKAERGRKFFTEQNTTHGESRTRLYVIWSNMINRTTNPSNKDYKNYGGRGISVYEDWQDFLKFKEWAVSNGYKDNLTLDRKDNNKSYYPGNCRWTDRKTQDNNKRQSRKETYNGKTQTIEMWAEEYNINRGTLVNRLNKGMTIKEALETPIKGRKTGYKPHKARKK